MVFIIKYSINMHHKLDDPIREVINSPEYLVFMSCAPRKDMAWWWFTTEDTVRKVWNTITLWRPIYCAKKHEMPGVRIEPIACVNRENPCCGHPENTWMYHGLGVGGYLAQELDTTIPHPAEALRALVWSDSFGFSAYRPGWNWAKPSQEQIEIVQENERQIYETITLPYMQRVSEVLKKL
jgi:hypothetical protein